MIRGGEVYRDIQQRVKLAEERLDDVRQNLRRVSETLDKNRVSESGDLAKLARVRFNELEGARVARGLDAADQEVLTILEHKRVALEEVERQLDDTRRDQAAIETERTRLRIAVDEVRARAARALEGVKATLAATEAYEFQRTRAQRTADQATGAAEKATQAESDRVTKGKPYEDNRLFSYLWKRRYKFPAYRATLLTRALDKWVAKLCKYDDAHRDYGMLLEIPIRLREHADALQAAADVEAQAQAAMEAEAFATGGLPALEEEIHAREDDLAACEVTLAGAEESLADLRGQRARFDADEDEHTQQAIVMLAAHMAREPIASLRADAVRSQTPADDVVVTKIETLRTQRDELMPELADYREQQQAALKSLEDLEKVRRTFREREYDSDDSVFEDGPRTSSLLRGLLNGALVVGQVLTDMKSNQRFERPSGGRRHSTGWDWGSSGPSSPGGGWSGGGSSGGSSSSSSSSSSSGGGGFRTVDRF